MNVAHRPWFQGARDKPYLGDAHKAVLLEEKLNNNSNTPLRFVDVAVPLQNAEGNFAGVLGAHLYLDWVASLGESLLAPLQERLQAELILANKNGVVIVGPEDSVGRTLNESLVQPAQSLRNTLIVSGVLLALLLIVFAVYTARRTTRPLLQMAREADRLDPDNPSSPIQLRDDYEEVRVLSSVLRDLVQRLTNKAHQMNEQNASLEHRVAERTRALEEANQRLEETVRTDALTGLNNRRFFFELGQTALKKAIRADKPMAAQEALRDTDILARLGGEEFAVLLENTDEDAASEVAERLRQKINDMPLSLERGQITLSISAGVACLCPEGGDDLDTLLVLADTALYAAKSGGRNRVARYSQVNVENTPPGD